MTLITVAHPRSKREIRHCLQSFRHWNPEPFDWVLLTEAENVGALQEIAGDLARVEAMAPEAEAVRRGYYRQQAAKLFAYRSTDDPQIVITDDDTEAVAPWSSETLFDGDRARIWYRIHSLAFWLPGQRWVFPGRCTRDFQLLLPFAIRRETLQAVAESEFGARALTAWHRSELVSEFMVMGEYASRHDQERAVFLNADQERHWSLNRTPFRDWQAFRPALRRKIAREH